MHLLLNDQRDDLSFALKKKYAPAFTPMVTFIANPSMDK